MNTSIVSKIVALAVVCIVVGVVLIPVTDGVAVGYETKYNTDDGASGVLEELSPSAQSFSWETDGTNVTVTIDGTAKTYDSVPDSDLAFLAEDLYGYYADGEVSLFIVTGSDGYVQQEKITKVIYNGGTNLIVVVDGNEVHISGWEGSDYFLYYVPGGSLLFASYENGVRVDSNSTNLGDKAQSVYIAIAPILKATFNGRTASGDEVSGSFESRGTAVTQADAFNGSSKTTKTSAIVETENSEVTTSEGVLYTYQLSDTATATLGSRGTLSIAGTGTIDGYASASAVPWSAHMADIRTITVADGISNIPDYAFYGATAVTSIGLPSSVTSIGGYAFAGCTALVTATLGGTVTIGDYAFQNDAALTGIDLSAVTTVGTGAFDGATAMSSVVFGSDVNVSYGSSGDVSAFPYSFYASVDGNLVEITQSSDLEGKTFALQDGKYTVVEDWIIVNDVLYAKASLVEAGYSSSSLAPWNGQTYSSVSSPSATKVGDYAFYQSPLRTFDNLSSVTSIGNYAFYGCTSLALTSLPSGLTSIGSTAFYGCTSLAQISLPENMTSLGSAIFWDCTALTTVSMPAVTSIDNMAFFGCTALTTVSMPAVTHINSSVFFRCTAIASISFGSGLTSIGNDAFSVTFYENKDGTYTALDATAANLAGRTFTTEGHDGKLAYDYQAWTISADGKTLTILDKDVVETDYTEDSLVPWNSYKASIESVVFPSGVTSIGSYAFSGCTGLALTSLPSGVTSIGSYAFTGCAKLQVSTLPSGLITLNTGAFRESGISISALPDGVTSIPSNCFYGTTNLSSLSLPSVTRIYSSAFANSHVTHIDAPVLTQVFGGNSQAEGAFGGADIISITAPKLSHIGNYAFAGSNLESFEFSEGTISNSNMSTVGTCVFENCTHLTDVSGMAGFTKFPSMLFAGCSNLSSFEFPAGLTNISYGLFYNCTSLSITALPDTVTEVSSEAFKYAGISELHAQGVTLVGYESFKGCRNLTTISMPALTEIVGGAFYDCMKLEITSLPSSVTAIGSNAFENCQALALTALPSDLASIGQSAFRDCANLDNTLTTISFGSSLTTCYGTSLPFVFYGTDGTTALTDTSNSSNNIATTLAGHTFVKNSDGKYVQQAESSSAKPAVLNSRLVLMDDAGSATAEPVLAVSITAAPVLKDGGIDFSKSPVPVADATYDGSALDVTFTEYKAFIVYHDSYEQAVKNSLIEIIPIIVIIGIIMMAVGMMKSREVD